MARGTPTVAQLFRQINAIRAQRDGPDRTELLSMWKMLGAIVSLFEVIILNSPALVDHAYVNHELRELVEMHKDMVGDTPGDDEDDEPPTKRRRLDDDDDDDGSAPGPSAGPSTGPSTSRNAGHSIDSDSDLNEYL